MKQPSDPALKEALKEAVAEVLHEQRGWFEEVIADVLQEMALAEALREVEATAPSRKPPGFGLVEGEA